MSMPAPDREVPEPAEPFPTSANAPPELPPSANPVLDLTMLPDVTDPDVSIPVSSVVLTCPMVL